MSDARRTRKAVPEPRGPRDDRPREDPAEGAGAVVPGRGDGSLVVTPRRGILPPSTYTLPCCEVRNSRRI